MGADLRPARTSYNAFYDAHEQTLEIQCAFLLQRAAVEWHRTSLGELSSWSTRTGTGDSAEPLTPYHYCLDWSQW